MPQVIIVIRDPWTNSDRSVPWIPDCNDVAYHNDTQFVFYVTYLNYKIFKLLTALFLLKLLYKCHDKQNERNWSDIAA